MIDLSDVDLEQFLTKWHGMPDRSATRAVARPDLPEPLRAWHELTSQWSDRVMAVKEFTPLDEVAFRDDKAIFLADPANAIWALDSAANVYEGRRYEGWVKLPESLSEFLTHNAIMEAAYGAPVRRYCDSVENSWMTDALAPLTEVATNGWNWPAPNYRVFMSDNLIAVVGPAMEGGAALENEAGFSGVQFGATTPSSLSHLESIPGDWF
ncbi:hypothetical protein ACGF5O_44670 [Streptomyces sp. NPDC048291]|uniref:hypothetical protein n=1 Tax=Streptomyces sp. NPDC048291 TaxID=3365530 RepID=UPI0037126EFB